MKNPVKVLKGFSLIELLVVIAVIGVLSGSVVSIINFAGSISKANVVRSKSFQRKVLVDVSLSEVASWNFNDSLSPLQDTSGNGNNGSMNAATIDSGCAGLGFGSCLKLGGAVNQYVSVPNSLSLQITTYTVSIWIWPNGAPDTTWKGIIGKPGRNFNIWLNAAGNVHHRFHTSVSTNAGPPDTPVGLIKWNDWNYIVITNDGVTAKTYINGELKASGAISGTLIADSTTLYIGRNLDGGSSEYFNGFIDEVSIYSQALSALSIRQHYIASLPRHLLAMTEGKKQTGEKGN